MRSPRETERKWLMKSRSRWDFIMPAERDSANQRCTYPTSVSRKIRESRNRPSTEDQEYRPTEARAGSQLTSATSSTCAYSDPGCARNCGGRSRTFHGPCFWVTGSLTMVREQVERQCGWATNVCLKARVAFESGPSEQPRANPRLGQRRPAKARDRCTLVARTIAR